MSTVQVLVEDLDGLLRRLAMAEAEVRQLRAVCVQRDEEVQTLKLLVNAENQEASVN